MEQREEASWAPSSRPRRHLRQPLYLRDYEVSAVRPKIRGPPHVSPVPHTPRGDEWSSQPHVKWSRLPNAQDDYSTSLEESINIPSLGWPHTPMPYTEDEPSRLHGESMQYSFASPHDDQRESRELTASARVLGAAQQDPPSEPWPVPPLPLPGDSLVLEEEEYEEGLPPPPWPSHDYPPAPAAAEEQRVVTVIDRMMSELQLMRDSMTSSVTAHTRPQSTPRSWNHPQPKQGPEQHHTRSYTPGPAPYMPISRPQPSMYRTDAESSTQYPARPDTSQPHPARGRQFSPASVTLGGGEYRGPAPRIPFFVHKDPMEFSRLKLALANLLPADATELFKYQILVDHMKLEEACLIADSFINSPRPYSDTMAALTEKFGQPHHVALQRIAAVMDSSEIRRGDVAAFERFSLHVQSLVGMLQTPGPRWRS
jgi:hypothetical protein